MAGKTGAVDAQAIFNLAQATASIPGVRWILGDDLCDCTFQRVGEWTNPYLAETLRVRVCCFWEIWFKEHPELVQRIPAYFDVNRAKYVSEPAEWDSDEMDMPVGLWFRQLAHQLSKPLAWVRQSYADRKHDRPKRVKSRRPNHPTQEELAYAREQELRAAGWWI